MFSLFPSLNYEIVMLMKIGVDTYSFQVALAAGSYDVFAALDRLEGLGCSGLQININGRNGRFLGADPSNSGHLRKVRAALERKGFFLEIGGSGTGSHKLRWQLQLCAELGADTLRTVVAFKESLEHTMEQSRRDLESCLPLADSLGVAIALENHEDITAGELCRLLAEIDHPMLGACFDSGNDLSVYEDPVDSARLLASRAISTHIKDQKLIRVGGQIFSVGVRLGDGDVDLPSVLDVIGRESSLDRILVQDTIGYAARLNPCDRADLKAKSHYAGIPDYPDRPAAESDGCLLGLDMLAPEDLSRLAELKDRAIDSDVACVRRLLGV